MTGEFKHGSEKYMFKEVGCDIGGRGFEVSREKGATYHVHLGNHTTCECLGYLRHGHCRHINGLREALGQRALRNQQFYRCGAEGEFS